MDTARDRNKYDGVRRHVIAAERMVARQILIVDALERDDDPDAVQQARRLLNALQINLDLARNHLLLCEDRQANHEWHVRLCGE